MIAHKDIVFDPRIAPVKVLNVQRSPTFHSCTCGYGQTLLLPDHPGSVIWSCFKCKAHNRINFHAEVIPTQGHIQLKPRREPIQHECQQCGRNDLMILPTNCGEIRWKCTCSTEWIMRFQPNAGRLGMVKRGIIT